MVLTREFIESTTMPNLISGISIMEEEAFQFRNIAKSIEESVMTLVTEEAEGAAKEAEEKVKKTLGQRIDALLARLKEFFTVTIPKLLKNLKEAAVNQLSKISPKIRVKVKQKEFAKAIVDTTKMQERVANSAEDKIEDIQRTIAMFHNESYEFLTEANDIGTVEAEVNKMKEEVNKLQEELSKLDPSNFRNENGEVVDIALWKNTLETVLKSTAASAKSARKAHAEMSKLKTVVTDKGVTTVRVSTIGTLMSCIGGIFGTIARIVTAPIRFIAGLFGKHAAEQERKADSVKNSKSTYDADTANRTSGTASDFHDSSSKGANFSVNDAAEYHRQLREATARVNYLLSIAENFEE